MFIMIRINVYEYLHGDPFQPPITIIFELYVTTPKSLLALHPADEVTILQVRPPFELLHTSFQ